MFSINIQLKKINYADCGLNYVTVHPITLNPISLILNHFGHNTVTVSQITIILKK